MKLTIELRTKTGGVQEIVDELCNAITNLDGDLKQTLEAGAVVGYYLGIDSGRAQGAINITRDEDEPEFYWESNQHPDYTQSDWREAVAQDETTEGYNHWVHSRLNEDPLDDEDDDDDDPDPDEPDCRLCGATAEDFEDPDDFELDYGRCRACRDC